MQIYLVRHGETEWSKTGQHTGRTDIALTETGRQQAARLTPYLATREPFQILCSPLQRAKETCQIAGYADQAIIDPDLAEWNYGVYEGRTTEEIRAENPAWSVWLAPIPNGESLDEVAARADRVIARIVASGQNTAVFAHGHILRILAARWTGHPAGLGRYLALDTASVSMLGFERKTRVIRQWNVIP